MSKLARANILKTWLIFSIFFGIIAGLGWIFSRTYANPAIFVYAVIFSVLTSGFSYWFSDKVVIALAGAEPADRQRYPEFYAVVAKLASKAKLPMPKLYVINDDSPNAFATGRNPKHAAVASTTGLLSRMNREELEGVIAHELSHVSNRDILVSTIAAVLVGFISIIANWSMRMSFWGRRDDREERGGSNALFLVGLAAALLAPLAATLMQLAISRKRESLADASGAMLAGNPEGLASALAKIADHPGILRRANNATSHLYIENPFKADTGREDIRWIIKIFLTHPPVEERIRALRGR